MKGLPLNEEQQEFISNQYLKISVTEISKQINKSTSAIRRYMHKNGLQIPAEILKERKHLGQFKKEQTPYNKGEKMPPEVYEKVKATMFKKGHAHKDARFEYTDMYGDTFIKHNGIWRKKNRWIYEQNYGAIRPKHLIVFKDGNKQNFEPTNLEMISQRENIKRNRNEKLNIAAKNLADGYVAGILKRGTQLSITDIPLEIIELKRTQLKINRELKKLNQNESK